MICRAFWSVLGMHHKQHVWKSCPKVRAVRVMMPRTFWRVNVHALGTVALDHRFARNVAQAQRQHRLRLAVDARTVAEIARLILLDHLSDATIRKYVTCVNETVQHLGGLLDQVGLIWIIVQIVV